MDICGQGCRLWTGEKPVPLVRVAQAGGLEVICKPTHGRSGYHAVFLSPDNQTGTGQGDRRKIGLTSGKGADDATRVRLKLGV